MVKQLFKSAFSLIPEKIRYGLFRMIGSTLKENFPSHNMFNHIQLMKKLGFEPTFVIDIGSYVGNWTKNTLNIYPNSRYLLIEAQKSKIDILESFTSQFDNVFFENSLVGDQEKANINFFDMETGSSIYEENSSIDRRIEYLNMTTLDALASKNKMLGKGLLKLDVQGAEIDVLKGATKTLKSIEFILLEASTLNYNEKAPLVAEVIEYLERIGYCLFDICDVRRNGKNVLFQVDLIFIRKDSKFRKEINFKKPPNMHKNEYAN